MFYQQLILLRKIFQENSYPESFVGTCFKLLLNTIHILKGKVPTAEKKPLRLALPYLGTISLQTRTKLQKGTKGELDYCKLFVIFKSQNKPSRNNSCFKDRGSCNEPYNGKYIRDLAVRSTENTGIAPLTNKRVLLRKDSAVCHHLLNCNYSSTFRIRSTF